MKFIKEHDKELVKYCVEQLKEIDEVELLLNQDIKKESNNIIYNKRYPFT